MTAGLHSEPAGGMHAEVARIVDVARDTADTCTLSMEAFDGGGLPPFAPGQFSMLYAYGVGEIPVSISGDPGVPNRLAYTIRSVGAVSRALIGSRAGDAVAIRGPFGTSWPVEQAQGGDLLLVAGGIGLAPLRPAIYEIARNRSKYDRVVILYGARNPKELLYTKELKTWRRLSNFDVLTTVDVGGSSWRGHVGVVTKLFGFTALRPERTTVMTCGPEIMMRFVVRELRQRGFADEQIYLSMERNMKCAIGFCGHCQMGPHFICKDGPVFAYPEVRRWIGGLREL